MEELIQLKKFPVKDVLAKLLQDKTTGKNIIFATDTYRFYGSGYSDTDEITPEALNGFGAAEIQPRVLKTSEQQSERTRKKAEVFSPTWIVRKMNDHCDSVWQEENNSDEWQKYVQLRVLEITCGEAPFLATRYDMTTGELMPTAQRTGMLDRKLQTINAHAADEKEWLKWTYKAYQSTYGYEYQGDSLLIARVNLLVTFCEYYEEKFQKQPEKSELSKITNIIAWNIWQMDGLKDTVPLGMPGEKFPQLSLFDDEPEKPPEDDCKIYDWRSKKTLLFREIKEVDTKMKFDFILGNPPYQQESRGANENDTPIYHYFYNSSFEISDKVELITPARFLFNAGGTPKAWNQQMLEDKHFKVLSYEADSSKVFDNVDIKGGVAITYRDTTKNFGAIEVFTAYNELNSIKNKVDSISSKSLSDVITNRGIYRYSDKAYEEQPEEMAKTADRRIAPSSFERMPLLFTEKKPNDGNEYIQIYGNLGKERVYRWFRKDYVKEVENLYKYKVMVPKANGSGAIGEVLSTPLIGVPLIGFTETYISIGETYSLKEAESTLKYIKTKFARTMLGILKVTQNNAKPTWAKVPMQDFTQNSDIDWSVSIAEIDKQLYKKYNLSQEEIDFIETHVKEME